MLQSKYGWARKNTWQWENQQELEDLVDRLIAEQDLAAFAIMHAIADKVRRVVE